MITLKRSLQEKLEMDKAIEEMNQYPIDFSDIPPVEETETDKSRFGYERFLRLLPQDILKELARRRMEDIKRAGYCFEDSSVVKLGD